MDKRVQKYFAAVPPARRRRLKQLESLVLGTYPKAEVLIWYGIPTYRAREGWVNLANQKSCVTLYTTSPRHIASFKERHPDIKTGKACINFRDSDRIPAADLRKVIRSAMENTKSYAKKS